jgi:carbon monoxide dehydrogenase subunit G
MPPVMRPGCDDSTRGEIMKLSGEATLHGPVDAVYAALNDPAVLVRTIPGCQRLERVGEDAYRMVVSAGVAAIKGIYVGDVRLTDQDVPHSFVLKASGSGGPGTVSADVKVRLAGGDNGTTLLTYDADAVIGGMVGGVGQRVLSGVAKKTANEFFAAVDGILAGGLPAGAGAEAAGAAGAEAAGAGAAGALAGVAAGSTGAVPAVFERPRAPARFAGGSFVTGAAVGAAAALAGAFVGGLIVGRAVRKARRG